MVNFTTTENKFMWNLKDNKTALASENISENIASGMAVILFES